MVATARTGHDGRPRVKRAAEELLQSLHRIVAIVEVPWVDVNDEVAQPQPYADVPPLRHRSEEHTSELQSLMRISYAVFCLKNKNKHIIQIHDTNTIAQLNTRSTQH